MAKLSIKEFLEAGVHYGHRTSRWHPKMGPYIYGKRKGIHIIDLRQMVRGLAKARRFLGEMASRGEGVLFVGTKRQAAVVVREEAGSRGLPYVSDRWLGGMLTNFQTIRRSLGRLEELERLERTGELQDFSKKMISMLQREKRKILRNLEGVRNMTRLPGAMVVVDPRRDKIAVLEAIKLGIPIVGILDTDCDPSQIDICIPCNDDSLRSVQLVLGAVIEAVTEGQGLAQAAAADEAGKKAAQRPVSAPAPAPAPAPTPPPAAQGGAPPA